MTKTGFMEDCFRTDYLQKYIYIYIKNQFQALQIEAMLWMFQTVINFREF